MIKVDSRESAHVQSRVKDLSIVPNLVSYTGLFAAITPISKVNQNDDETYSPILIRDTDSLIANFGDPRIDPEKYIDLYSIMQVVGNGTCCYVAKVNSGNTGVYHFNFLPLPASLSDTTFTTDGVHLNIWTAHSPMPLYLTSVKVANIDTSSLEGSFGIPIADATEEFITAHSADDGNALILNREDLSSIVCELEENPADQENPYKITVTFKENVTDTALVTANSAESAAGLIGYSSMSDQLNFVCKLTQVKPLSLKVFYLTIDVTNGGNTLASAKVKLEPTTTNQSIVNSLNSSLGTYVRFELAEADKEYAAAAEVNNMRDHSIATALLDVYAPHTLDVPGTAEPNRNSPREDLPDPNFEVALDRNESASDPDVEPSFEVTLDDYIKALEQYRDKRYVGCLMADLTAPVNNLEGGEFAPAVHSLSYEERRSLHFNLKQIACERKDTTVILSVPYTKEYTDLTPMTLDEVCDWVASQGDYNKMWGYGETNTTDYAQQSFYLEIYYSWLKLKCAKIANGLATSVDVNVAPANVVVNNILTSWRERGVQYPVAGDQYGTLTDQCSVLQNPKTKLERDQLVQYRINPIWDTGTRGVQIYGNETLNAGYTDLNAAHIARALVYIRSRIDEYTERLKFSINSIVLWDTWKNNVIQNILEPLKTSNCLAEYRVLMGTETTSAAEIANRRVNGIVELIFFQSAEIFDLTYTIYSSSTTIEEASANQ